MLILGFDSFVIGLVYREGNRVANALAALGLFGQGLKCCRRMDSLPINVRLLLAGEYNI